VPAALRAVAVAPTSPRSRGGHLTSGPGAGPTGVRRHHQCEPTAPRRCGRWSEVGAGSLLALFSAVYADSLEGRLAETYTVPPFPPHPTENEAAIVEEVRGCKGWPVHREDLDMSDLVEMTRLQMWTLKPAQAR